MGMFTELYPLTVTTRLAMLISADAERGVMTVSVMPRAAQTSTPSPARDLTLTATPEEFDAGFVDALLGYRAKLVPLLEQAAANSKALEEARSASPKPAKTPSKTSSHSKPPAAGAAPRCAAVDEAGEQEKPNDDPDRDWMKNRQPELF
ncbi:PRTRC system protein E [Pseudoduganella namucuonensis]|uniref:PRTRC system protein E n=1 Tax=Pseudoduganella namucuonensis TaxID=1035707 RepID=A0A1I7M4F7_9BURK|nr:PRTRC system protein E [Pseudoduganella namucuonensis]SFV16829.1 PRTRC system protein E [Pseudoduganella namucuonensis]